jgi:drug/metabolite transporter (DMT)-like permease
MLRRRRLRRSVGFALLVAGAILMWLAPASTFDARSAAGAVLLLVGIALEMIGIALERRDKRRNT